MRIGKNIFFNGRKFVLSLAAFFLFCFGVGGYGQKPGRADSSSATPQTVKKQSSDAKEITYWSETRKAGGPRKLALLVGISDYSKCIPQKGKPCWWDLHSKTDVQELSKVLSGANFEFEVIELKDSQATKEGIKQAFEKLASLTREGDIVYLHFSGHGTTLPDQPAPYGDEVDGMDEAIVPYDYGYKDNAGGLIIDDEINKWLTSLKNNKPLSLTVTFDSCRSGTATRGGTKRGDVWGGSRALNTRGTVVETSASGLVENNKKTETGFVFISAAKSDEVALETNTEPQMGEFTKALIKTLIEAKPNSTYRDAFEKIKDLVSRNQGSQNPQIEGDWDNLLMGNSVLPTDAYFTIKLDRADYILQAGKLHGMRIGSRFAVYEAGTKKNGEPGRRKLADAEIIQVYPLTSVIKLEKTLKPDDLIGARAFETGRKLDVDALKVAVDNTFPESNLLEETVKNYEFVQLIKPKDESRTFDVLFRKRDERIDTGLSEDGNIVMERNNGSVRAFSSRGEQLKKEIKEALEREVRWKTVKELENSYSDLRIEMRIVPIKSPNLNPVGRRDEYDFGIPLEPVTGGTGLNLNLGDYFRVEVKNNSGFLVYITVLGLSEGKVTANFPVTDEDKEDEKNKIISDGQWKPITVSRITLPLGVEGYKLIATKQQADFTSLIDPSTPNKPVSSTRKRGEENAKRLPLGQLFAVLSGGRRGNEIIESAPPEAWTTITVTYEIKCPVVNGVKACCEDRTRKPWVPVECKAEL